jgi:hypothetical protein
MTDIAPPSPRGYVLAAPPVASPGPVQVSRGEGQKVAHSSHRTQFVTGQRQTADRLRPGVSAARGRADGAMRSVPGSR